MMPPSRGRGVTIPAEQGKKRLSLRIPLKPATDSETKPATCSDFIPASIPI
jgi:hypothetical protein